jgi:hypothetical protein
MDNPAFYTATGVGTQVAGGRLPWRYAPDGSIAMVSPPKDIRVFDGREYVLGRVDRTDLYAAGAPVATHNQRHLGADGLSRCVSPSSSCSNSSNTMDPRPERSPTVGAVRAAAAARKLGSLQWV